jgi:GxxExxY protein
MLFYVAVDPETYGIIGAALRVHGSLGPGFLEAVYQEALSIELAACGIPFSGEAEIPVF